MWAAARQGHSQDNVPSPREQEPEDPRAECTAQAHGASSVEKEEEVLGQIPDLRESQVRNSNTHHIQDP